MGIESGSSFIAKKIPSSEEIKFPSDKLFERPAKPRVPDSMMVDGGSGDRALQENEKVLKEFGEGLQEAIRKGNDREAKRYLRLIELSKEDKGRIISAG